MKLVKGNNLTEAQRKHVLQAFIYRLTVENNYPERNPCGATVDPITDKQWLTDHAFYITNDDDLSGLHTHCEPSYLADTFEQVS